MNHRPDVNPDLVGPTRLSDLGKVAAQVEQPIHHKELFDQITSGSEGQVDFSKLKEADLAPELKGEIFNALDENNCITLTEFNNIIESRSSSTSASKTLNESGGDRLESELFTDGRSLYWKCNY